MHKTFIIFLSLLVLLALISSAVFETKERYDPKISELKSLISKIHPEVEYLSISSGSKGSYTENKKRIVLCLKSPKTGKYYSNNTLVYVLLHEIAHVISKKFGHGEEFNKNFKKLLDAAEKEGIYDSKLKIPDNYCKT